MNERTTMNKKPVLTVPAKGVINFKSGFVHKLLCDGPTFSTGTGCAYSCGFCYVPDMMRKAKQSPGHKHEDVVIRREGALDVMRSQLCPRGKPKFLDDLSDRRVIYSSPLVDVAANMELVKETVEACKLILELTNWQIRLLSKSNLLPLVAQGLRPHPRFFYEEDAPGSPGRVMFGVSTGTLDDKLAAAFEQGTPKVSKRIQSLHWLQDNGFRTYGMICPSLPQKDYRNFAWQMRYALRIEKCEHVWAEVINVRGDSMVRTCAGLRAGGFEWEANELERVAEDKAAWEQYSRDTFEAHTHFVPPHQLRFLQYVNNSNRAYWESQKERGAVLL